MPNLAASLKSEIARIARKEVRAGTASMKKATTAHRAEIAALKMRNLALETELRRLEKLPKPQARVADLVDAPDPRPMSTRALKAIRPKFGLSAHALGTLIGVSTQSIYNWESDKARPQAKHLAALAYVKERTKAEVTARLRALGA